MVTLILGSICQSQFSTSSYERKSEPFKLFHLTIPTKDLVPLAIQLDTKDTIIEYDKIMPLFLQDYQQREKRKVFQKP